MKTTTALLQDKGSAAHCLSWFGAMLCSAFVCATQLLSAPNSLPPGSLDTNFASSVHRSRVGAILMQPDGRLLVGGVFSIPGVGTNLVRFTRDGAPDPTFARTARGAGNITKLALQPDGRVLVGNKGGVFGGYPTIGLTRFLPDGSADSSFQFRLPTNSINNGIWSGFWTTALTVQPDGRILLAGHYERDHFDYWYWSPAHLQRLLPDGSDGEFFSFSWPSPECIGVLVLLPDQRLLVAGDQLARLNPDGTEDSGFLRTILSAGEIKCCVAQADGKVLVGGNFTNIQGSARCRVARMLPDGRLDHSFNPPVSTRDDDPLHVEVCALAVQPDGRILVGGNFETVDGLPYAALARLNLDGSLDTTFAPIGHRDEEEDTVAVNAVATQGGDRALVGGENLVTPLESGDLFRIHLGEPALRLAMHQVAAGTLQLRFNYSGSNDFTVLTTTNLNQPVSNWIVAGSATNLGADLYQFTDRVVPSEAQRYYQLRKLDTP